METAIYVIGWANNALLVALSVLTVLLARRTGTRTGRLLAAAVVTFTIGTLTGWLPWAVGETTAHEWFSKGRLLVQFLVPYLLLRLAHAFDPFRTTTMRIATAAVIAISVLVVGMPVNFADPEVDITRGVAAVALGAYIVWVVSALVAVAVRFRSTGRGQPGAIRSRMYLLSAATVAMLLAYITAFAAVVVEPFTLQVASMLLVAASTIAFVAGVAPTTTMRLRWRREEEHELRGAITALMAADTREEVLDTVIPTVRRVVGASAVAFLHGDGAIERVDGSTPRAEALLLDALGDRATIDATAPDQVSVVPFGASRLALRTTPATPLVGDVELELLAWVGSVVELALARCAHLAEDRAVTERLREVDRLKNEFVQIVAHDLRSPMAAVSGLAGTLHDRWDDLDHDTKLTMLDHIGSSTQRMADLVVDVLDIARIESGELRYDLAPFDMRAVVQQVADDLETGVGTVRIRLALEDELPLALGDERRHRQVVANLLGNALKYSPEDEPVRVSVAVDTDSLVVEVRDHGDGIAEDAQSRIFEKFGRAVERGDATPGSGLGLYICKAMVEAQGGRIWVESTPGAGSTFRFTAPIASH